MNERRRSTTFLLTFATWIAGPSAFAEAETKPAASAADASDRGEVSEESKKTGEQAGEAQVQQVKLSDRIKSVQKKPFLKKSRIELFPHFALDLNDPFYQHLIAGGAVGYHLADSLAVEARGGVVFASIQQSAIRFVRRETDSLVKDVPEFRYHGDLDLVWAPVYGKISLFGESILHFDTYLTAGPGVFGTDAGPAAAANVGIGQRYFITDWLTARFELRDYIFMDTRNSESDVQNLLVFGVSVSGFFPMSFEHEFQ